MKKTISLVFLGVILSLWILLITCNKPVENIDVFSSSWEEIENAAMGQTVYFNAWAGNEKINQYITWVGKTLKSKYDINLIQVKVKDILHTVRQIQQEKHTNTSEGSVDLLWLNGDAFRILKTNDLFLGNILDVIPNKTLIDPTNPILYEDFTLPTNGLEIPWGTAQLNFFHRSSKVPAFYNLDEFTNIVKANPGIFTYPNPSLDFTGRTFIKTLIYILADDTSVFYKKFDDTGNNILENNKVWNFLDTVHPYLWKKGVSFPNNVSDLNMMFQDSRVHYGLAFNPYFVLNKYLTGEFDESVRSFLIQEGTIANAHFLSIPYNATHRAPAALVTINFLLSNEAQQRKGNPQYWGDPTVLKTKTAQDFSPEYKIRIAKDLNKNTIKEFHASWEEPIKQLWNKRYLNQ